MRHEDWLDLEAERRRHLRDRERDSDRDRARDRDREDYGQADYSNLYGYDPHTRAGYRAYEDGREPFETADDRREAWDEDRHLRRSRRRDGPSDRVLWAVITERLDDERRLDLRDVEISVHHAEVTLNGTVRHKADKRRIEDIADVEGVRHVQNNLRVRERGRWMLF